MDAPDLEFNRWARRWIELATFRGRQLLDDEQRIAELVSLWNEPIPGKWMRGRDRRLVNPERRYCRSNHLPEGVRRGEHAVEFDVLNPSPAKTHTSCLGARLVDGVNAVPLAKDSGGGRSGNVEADMLLLAKEPQRYRLLLVEVKVSSNDPWFAAVENLRQMRLFWESRETQNLFHVRHPELDLGQSVQTTGIVLAPSTFYSTPRKKAASVAPARKLLERMRTEVGVDLQLATWEPQVRAIEPLEHVP